MALYNNGVCLGNWFEDKIMRECPDSTKTTRVLCDYGVRDYQTDNQFQVRER